MKNIIFSLAFSLGIVSLTAQSYDSLDINNIHAGFNAAGDLFYNINTGNGHITSPGNKIQYSIANLWVAGLDAGNQLHIAAQTYRQTGTDFWPGVLDTVTITCDTPTSNAFNKVWKLNCSAVDSFVAYTQGTPSPGYSVPLDIQNWPGNGDASLDQTPYLAPFVDADNDGYYSWSAGDYPVVRGNQSLFYVYNDNLISHTHTETYGQHLGIEIQAMPYAFDYPWDNALMNTIFVHYKIINHSPVSYNAARIGFWSDINMTTATKTGSDSLLGAFYNYGTDNAAGVVFLNTPMAGCIAYNNNNFATGNPATDQQYYNYLQQEWKDGSPLTSGNGGYGGTTQTNWMYNGDPVTGTGWNDNSTSDKRNVGSTSSFVFQPGMTYTFDVAMVFANDTTSALSSVTLLKQYMQEVKTFYQGQSQICTPGLTGISTNATEDKSNFVFPNPATDQITFSSEEKKDFRILNSEGQLVLSGRTTEKSTTISISSFASGIYFIQIDGIQNSHTHSFIKTN